jgi:hypothetical protein
MGTTGRLVFMDAQETISPTVARTNPAAAALPRTFNINRGMTPLPLSQGWTELKKK